MSGSHATGRGPVDGLFFPGHSPVHRLRPQCKLAAGVLFILAVVATPREAIWAYPLYAAVLVAIGRVARVPARFALRRMLIEVPFVAFAVFLPFLAGGERVDVGGVALSSDGLWAAWNILAKGTLGVGTSVLIAATTPVPAILDGLVRLRLPAAFTSVASFMVRYLEIVSGEMARMKVARLSRGYDPRWIWQARAVASSAGALFIRAFERGERVHLAMVSRGYSGTMPMAVDQAASRAQWLAALVLPAAAFVVASTAWLVRP